MLASPEYFTTKLAKGLALSNKRISHMAPRYLQSDDYSSNKLDEIEAFGCDELVRVNSHQCPRVTQIQVLHPSMLYYNCTTTTISYYTLYSSTVLYILYYHILPPTTDTNS